MADPINYAVNFDFSAYQSGNPKAVPSGVKLDNEFANIQTAIASLVSAVKDIRRADGKLKNELITLDAIDPLAQAGLEGPPGPAGAPGAPGANGAPGPQGPVGVNVTVSQSQPSGGANGDFWLVVA